MRFYNDLAGVYDRLMSHVDFSAHVDFCLRILSARGWKGRDILEIACGTGTIMLELLHRGFEVAGLDNSPEMLARADRKISASGYVPRLIEQDMRRITVPGSYDLVLCSYDSLNYILQKKELASVFKGVFQALRPGGMFLFDIDSEYRMRYVRGQNTFTFDEEDIFYSWRNDYDIKKQLCTMELDIFVLAGENSYKRFQELHIQRYYSPESIYELLVDSGFKQLGTYADHKRRKPSLLSERIFVLAQKV